MPGERRVDEVLVEGAGWEGLEEQILTNALVDLKALTQEQRGIMVHEVMSSIVTQSKVKDVAWLKLGTLWSFIVKNKLYKYAGDHIRNANDFLREVDIGVQRRELERYASAARIFGHLIRERPVPIRKLVMITPLCTDQDEAVIAEWFNRAAALPSAALEDEIREAMGRQTKDTCDHPTSVQEVWLRCGKCGAWLEKVQDAPGGEDG